MSTDLQGRPSDDARPAKRRRHLMDLDAPRPVRDPAADERSLTSVQRWVMSTLAISIILHFPVGLIIAGLALDNPPRSSEIGLSVISGVFGVAAVVAGRAIHRRRILSWWLLLGVVPAVIGLYVLTGS